jgi:hypothetical protein
MSKRLDVEFCKYCDDIYATNPEVWLTFKNTAGETSSSFENTFNCPRCGCLIERYSGYLEALERRETKYFIDVLIENITDLSDLSKETLRLLLSKFTVPSFAVCFNGKAGYEFSELIKKRYVTLSQTDGHGHVALNAYKLRLLDSLDLLERMSGQRSFIKYPNYIVKDNSYGKRREKRVNALKNDFTNEQKSEVLERFGSKCAFTGADVGIQMDHVIPVAVGHGGTTIANMLPVWQRINSSKGAKNVFEWYEENGERFGVCPVRFYAAIEYLADLNGMTSEEYRQYVYECHANPNDILTEAIN